MSLRRSRTCRHRRSSAPRRGKGSGSARPHRPRCPSARAACPARSTRATSRARRRRSRHGTPVRTPRCCKLRPRTIGARAPGRASPSGRGRTRPRGRCVPHRRRSRRTRRSRAGRYPGRLLTVNRRPLRLPTSIARGPSSLGALRDLPALHHERHLLEQRYIVRRITRHSNHVGEQARRHGAHAVFPPHQLG